MKITVNVWRQKNAKTKGNIVKYQVDHVSPDMSFLEMLDVLNQQLIARGEEAIAFDHDCREGICGSCGVMINGYAHGGQQATTACQLHMRSFKDGDEITVEPWRAKAFPVIKDLVVDRGAFDRIIRAGGFISAGTGSAPDANSTPIAKEPIGKIDILPEHFEVIHKAFIAVNVSGTSASSFVGAPYVSAGKTGTAQVFTVKQNEKYNASQIDERLRDHALYIAYAPADDPKVALAMVVENAGFGAMNAAPIARRVFDFVIMGQYPSREDIQAVQKGQATRPIGKPRLVSEIPWPPRDDE